MFWLTGLIAGNIFSKCSLFSLLLLNQIAIKVQSGCCGRCGRRERQREPTSEDRRPVIVWNEYYLLPGLPDDDEGGEVAPTPKASPAPAPKPKGKDAKPKDAKAKPKDAKAKPKDAKGKDAKTKDMAALDMPQTRRFLKSGSRFLLRNPYLGLKQTSQAWGYQAPQIYSALTSGPAMPYYPPPMFAPYGLPYVEQEIQDSWGGAATDEADSVTYQTQIDPLMVPYGQNDQGGVMMFQPLIQQPLMSPWMTGGMYAFDRPPSTNASDSQLTTSNSISVSNTSRSALNELRILPSGHSMESLISPPSNQTGDLSFYSFIRRLLSAKPRETSLPSVTSASRNDTIDWLNGSSTFGNKHLFDENTSDARDDFSRMVFSLTRKRRKLLQETSFNRSAYDDSVEAARWRNMTRKPLSALQHCIAAMRGQSDPEDELAAQADSDNSVSSE